METSHTSLQQRTPPHRTVHASHTVMTVRVEARPLGLVCSTRLFAVTLSTSGAPAFNRRTADAGQGAPTGVDGEASTAHFPTRI
jgi:hypothetical protein